MKVESSNFKKTRPTNLPYEASSDHRHEQQKSMAITHEPLVLFESCWSWLLNFGVGGLGVLVLWTDLVDLGFSVVFWLLERDLVVLLVLTLGES